MKKAFKVIGLIVAVIISLVIILAVLLLIKGPSDVIVLTEEELNAQNSEQIELFSNIDISGFNTATLTGETVSSDIFKDYEITMINLWTTDCSPCIAEMPDIAKLYNAKPNGSNIISICVDTVNLKKDIDKKAVKFATRIMSDAGVNFMTLIPDHVLQEELTDRTNIFPTTIFVDSKGMVVGEPHFGGTSEDDYREAILDRIALVSNKTEQK